MKLDARERRPEQAVSKLRQRIGDAAQRDPQELNIDSAIHEVTILDRRTVRIKAFAGNMT